jgi:hypothetical protein
MYRVDQWFNSHPYSKVTVHGSAIVTPLLQRSEVLDSRGGRVLLCTRLIVLHWGPLPNCFTCYHDDTQVVVLLGLTASLIILGGIGLYAGEK